MDGYGEFNPNLEQIVPRERFQGVEGLEIGMQFQANTEQGPISVRVTKVEGEGVTEEGIFQGASFPRQWLRNLRFQLRLSPPPEVVISQWIALPVIGSGLAVTLQA